MFLKTIGRSFVTSIYLRIADKIVAKNVYSKQKLIPLE